MFALLFVNPLYHEKTGVYEAIDAVHETRLLPSRKSASDAASHASASKKKRKKKRRKPTLTDYS